MRPPLAHDRADGVAQASGPFQQAAAPDAKTSPLQSLPFGFKDGVFVQMIIAEDGESKFMADTLARMKKPVTLEDAFTQYNVSNERESNMLNHEHVFLAGLG